MAKKILIFSLILISLLTGFGLSFVFKYKHQAKKIILRIATKTVHRLEEKKEPTRYNALSPVAFKDGIAVFAASSLDRIFQDGKTLLKPSFRGEASLSLAINEYESCQIVIQTRGRPLNNVELKISDLVNHKTGAVIDKNDVSWRVVGYVPTLEPYYPVKFVGPWPDPLLPAHPVDVKADMTQPFWVTIYTEAGTMAGDYNASIEVSANAQNIAAIPLHVHVYNFELPQRSHLKTAFDFYGHITKIRYPQRENESDAAFNSRINDINDEFIIAMLKYRMNPILNLDPSSQYELSKVDRYLVWGLNNFSIGKKGGTFDNNWPKDDESIEGLLDLYRTYAEDLKLNDLLQYSYIYTWDEGNIGNPRVAKVASMIHHAYPGLKNMVCYHGFLVPEKFPDWGKDIDIWCFNIDDFNDAKMRRLQEMGMEMWMYVSGPAGTGAPNLAMDFDSIDYRILPWLCWKYDIKGFLYWCVNWWPLVDPFENARNSQWEQNGNGLLFYPGKNGPLASIRTELFRDGMEDYEYIQILFEDLRTLKTKSLDVKYKEFFNKSINLLTVDASIASSMTHFTKDGELLNARRAAIARAIEEFSVLKIN